MFWFVAGCSCFVKGLEECLLLVQGCSGSSGFACVLCFGYFRAFQVSCAVSVSIDVEVFFTFAGFQDCSISVWSCSVWRRGSREGKGGVVWSGVVWCVVLWEGRGGRKEGRKERRVRGVCVWRMWEGEEDEEERRKRKGHWVVVWVWGEKGEESHEVWEEFSHFDE